MSADTVVSFDSVRMVFSPGIRQPVEALRSFTFGIERGSVVGLLGPNGSGKTTAISCLLGLLRPQEGEVALWGRPVTDRLPAGADRRVGVLLEDTRLPPFLSVRSALRAVGGLRGIPSRQTKAEIDRVVAQTRIEALLTRRVSVLSKGQARRVGLAAALVGDPPLLVLDEPSAGLDVAAREEFNALVRTLRDGHRTVLVASHLLSDIESTCSHIAIVRAGEVILHETAEALLREARSRCSEKDFHVESEHTALLERLGVRFETSKHPGLVRLVVEEPEHQLVGRLAAERVVPARIEPRVNLVSVYLEATGTLPD